MHATFSQRGFLPANDPLTYFDASSPFAVLDEVGRDLTSLLEDPGFRTYVQELRMPPWPSSELRDDLVDELRLYYVRLGFLASAYVNQVSQARATLLPRNIAEPLCHACRVLNRPPILSYDGCLTIETVSPRWTCRGNIRHVPEFRPPVRRALVHFGARGDRRSPARFWARSRRFSSAAGPRRRAASGAALKEISARDLGQGGGAARIPEKMDPSLYYKKFDRTFGSFDMSCTRSRGRSDPAPRRNRRQSSIMPTLSH